MSRRLAQHLLVLLDEAPGGVLPHAEAQARLGCTPGVFFNLLGAGLGFGVLTTPARGFIARAHREGSHHDHPSTPDP